MEPMSPLLLAAFLAFVIERIISVLVAPIFDRLKWDKFFLLYVGLAAGVALVLAIDLNIFMVETGPEEANLLTPLFNPTVGKILTCIIVGGGSDLLLSITSWASTVSKQITARLK